MDDFSTNRSSIKFEVAATHPNRHPDLWFSDGNIALVAGGYYFNVHRGILSRHSTPLADAIEAQQAETQTRLIEGSITLELEDDAKDVCFLLLALYDGVSNLTYDLQDFDRVSALLKLSTKYCIEHVRRDVLRGLTVFWPRTLSAWEFREANATDSTGLYKPRAIYPHPICVINLARETNTLELLPSAFYDLSRCTASEIASGHTSPASTESPSEMQYLSDEDLMNALKGREHASRFLSTFVVNELEGREASAGCLYRNDPEPFRKRICQATFEATTFEILRDVNGVVFHRSSDPLFAIMDADLMQSRSDSPNGRLGLLHPPCEPCRLDFTASVDAAREEMWRKLPMWFGIHPVAWS